MANYNWESGSQDEEDLETILPEFESIKSTYYWTDDKKREEKLEDLRKKAEKITEESRFDKAFHETGDVHGMKPYAFGGSCRLGRDDDIDFVLWLGSENNYRKMAKAYREYYRYNWFHDEVTGLMPEDIAAIVANRDGVKIGACAVISTCMQQYAITGECDRGEFWNARMDEIERREVGRFTE